MLRLLLFSAALLQSVDAHAQSPEEAEPEPCTPANAERVTLEQINTDFREWAGRCITVGGLHAYMGYNIGNRLWSSREATVEGLDPQGVSLTINYWSEIEHEAHPPRWEEVTGRFDSCVLAYERLQRAMDANPNMIGMLGGLCHYTSVAHFVLPTAYAPGDGPPVSRFTRSELSEEYRQFEPIDVTDEGMFPQREVFERMLHYIQHGEFPDYLRLSDPRDFQDYGDAPWHDFETEDFEQFADWYRKLDGLGEVWRDFRPDRGERIYALSFWEDYYGEDFSLDEPNRRLADWNEGGDAFLCLLREGFGPQDLPVRRADIDNQVSRPYFCGHVLDVGFGLTVEMPFSVTGFPEADRE